MEHFDKHELDVIINSINSYMKKCHMTNDTEDLERSKKILKFFLLQKIDLLKMELEDGKI